MNVPVSGGTTDPITMPVTLLASIARCSNSCATQMPISSEVRSRKRRQPPALDEPLALEHAEHDVRVADVNR